MADKQKTPYGTVILVLLLTLICVTAAASLVFHFLRSADGAPPADPRMEKLIAVIKTHPDPEIARDFLRSDGRFGMKEIAIGDLGHEDGEFNAGDGRGHLSIKREVIDATATSEGIQRLWVVLSHEHAHYLAWRDTGFYPRADSGLKLTEAQCTWIVTTEIDAYGKACRDARKYGWREASFQCDAVSLKRIAEEKMAHDLPQLPECGRVWRFFAGQADAAPELAPANAPAETAPAPVNRPGPTYLAPP